MTPPADPSNGDFDPQSIAELRRLARSRPTSGRAAVAKASAIRTLERLGRERRRQEVPPMPEGWYPREPGDPFCRGGDLIANALLFAGRCCPSTGPRRFLLEHEPKVVQQFPLEADAGAIPFGSMPRAVHAHAP
jgi:hypothetical protein